MAIYEIYDSISLLILFNFNLDMILYFYFSILLIYQHIIIVALTICLHNYTARCMDLWYVKAFTQIPALLFLDTCHKPEIFVCHSNFAWTSFFILYDILITQIIYLLDFLWNYPTANLASTACLRNFRPSKMYLLILVSLNGAWK